jgi:hypothetical protein
MTVKTKHLFFLVVAVFLTFPSLQTFAGSPITFEVLASFDYPNATATVANVITDRGGVGGWCVSKGPRIVRGFFRLENGQFSAPLTEPDSSTGTSYVNGRNNNGITTGYYETATGYDGFLKSGSTFTTVHLGGFFTYVEKINDAGNYCGSSSSGAFVNIGGTMTIFGVPGAGGTGADGINNLDQVVGGYSMGDSNFGYRRNADGTFEYPIAVPGFSFTNLHAINDRGWMVGVASSPSAGTHGVLFRSPSEFVLYDYPGSGTTTFTGINSRGLICGYYFDDMGQSHAFIVRAKLAAEE